MNFLTKPNHIQSQKKQNNRHIILRIKTLMSVCLSVIGIDQTRGTNCKRVWIKLPGAQQALFTICYGLRIKFSPGDDVMVTLYYHEK